MSTTPTPLARDGEPPAWYGKIPGAGDFVNHRLPHELAGWWERWLQQGMAAMRQRGADEIERYYTVAPVWNFLIPAGAGAQCVQPGCLAPSCDRVGRYYPVIATLPMRTADYWGGLPDVADAFYWQVGSALLDAIRHSRAPVQLEQTLARVRLVPGVVQPALFGGAGGGRGASGWRGWNGERGEAGERGEIGGAGEIGGTGEIGGAGDIGGAGEIGGVGEIGGAGESGDEDDSSFAQPLPGPPAAPAWPGLSQYFDPHGSTSFWWTNRADGSPLRTHAHTGAPDSRLFLRLFGGVQHGV
ncbi:MULTISPECIES: type VI secretion system-associated protein TagF [Burkholderia]|uniref:type VI secretion system-associated protein TagF n=1 Tax=Burkholderia TaxID=32008 RepID=UPI00075A4BEE|nr:MULTISPECIES: type VI secretion system-associated protein TagF [Burkholderia]AOJ72801.1 type VI secretion system protein ImpM [Burkholderia savannae]KVG44969.1 type VI secretion system protein ImpM [Burkholderia sp. MSMB0265]KVG89959.1 type VI secretion system protein ImpM [Burkholderia sp. MSMB2040]KVG96096.1 type VI secretion system protein ImpM [Burkholderia sp. MSMB2041]KVG99723.1 type VI secretion system protein ImpM [Burkholderia sp. MSMB2042]